MVKTQKNLRMIKLFPFLIFVVPSFDISKVFEHLDSTKWELCTKTLEKCSTVILKNKYNHGLSEVEYSIWLDDNRPIISYITQYLKNLKEAIVKELTKTKEVYFIEHSISPYAAPI